MFVSLHTLAPTQSPPGVKAPISSPGARGVPLMFGFRVKGTATVALFPVLEVNVKCVCPFAEDVTRTMNRTRAMDEPELRPLTPFLRICNRSSLIGVRAFFLLKQKLMPSIDRD